MMFLPSEMRYVRVERPRAGALFVAGDLVRAEQREHSHVTLAAAGERLLRELAGRLARGEPELAVLVVRQSDRLPGQGWWVGGAKQHGYTGQWEGPKAAKLIRTLQRQAFEFWAGREA